MVFILFKVDWGEKGTGWLRYFEIVILPNSTHEDPIVDDDGMSVSSKDKGDK